jgi:hypothetical protein
MLVLAALASLFSTMDWYVSGGGLGLDKAEWYGCLLFLAAVAILLALESSVTKLIVFYLMIPMLPDLVRRVKFATSSKMASAFAVTPRLVYSKSPQ